MTGRTYFIAAILSLAAGCSKKTGGKVPTTDNPVVYAADTVTTSTKNFKGVNWADPRDNFADDWLVPSGLSSSDDTATTGEKAGHILTAFRSQGINTVRLPVNPSTVLQAWWPRYLSVIRQATGKGMKVILACWEGASSKDGKVDNEDAFRLMWNTVMDNLSNNANVYFEIFNEPHGYSIDELKTLYADWLAQFPSLPRRRILLDGAGYATDVNTIGADSRFDGCLLSFHDYAWFENRETVADWEVPVRSLGYPDRTVVTEYGVPMTNGKDYGGHPGQDEEITYFQGMTNALHDLGVGNLYWPGLRTGDGYSMFGFNGSTLSTNNASGLSRLQYAWGNGSADPLYATFAPGSWHRIGNRSSGKALDVSGNSTANGGNIIQWDYSGGPTQQWALVADGNGYFHLINQNSGKALDVDGASTAGGAGIVQWDSTGNASQLWRVCDIGFGYYTIYNKNSAQVMDVNGGSPDNGAAVIQWYWNGGSNQQWEISGP